MVKIDISTLQQKMSNVNNIRNISVIAHVDHGKTTLTDSLVQAAGIIPEKNAGTARYTDTRKDEQERCITIKSTAISLLYNMDREYLTDDEKIMREKKEVIINLVDSPGHIDFTSEVTAAVRSTDGALLVVDCTKGVQAQTITVTKQAIKESVRPILFLNKFDTVFNTQGMKLGDHEQNEQAYHILNNICQDINNLFQSQLGSVTNPKAEYNVDNVSVDMLSETVAFGSAKFCWGLTPITAYDFLNRKSKPGPDATDEEKKAYLLKRKANLYRLWGDNFVDLRKPTRYVKTLPMGEERKHYVRGFVYTIGGALLKIKSYCEQTDHESLRNLIKDKDFVFPSDPKLLERNVLKKLFPLDKLIMEMIAVKLPSPAEAQKYRSIDLSTDPDPNSPTTKAIRECSPDGPLIAYCTKKSPQGNLSRPKIYTLARVISGTIQPNTQVVCMDSSFKLGDKVTKSNTATVTSVNIMIGKIIEPVNKMHCGNIIGIQGVDESLPGPGTIVEYSPNTTPFAPLINMSFVSVPLVSQRVLPRDQKNIEKLNEAAKLLSKLDLTCKIVNSDSGVVVYGVGPLHVEILIQDMKEMFGYPVDLKPTIINCAETVTYDEPKSSMTKSANHHNRITAKARILGDELTNYLDGMTNPDGATVEGLKADYELPWGTDGRVKITNDNLKKIMDFSEGNMLYDATSGFTHMDEMKTFIVDGLHRAIESGPICGERIRGVQYCIDDIVCHADTIHRGANQVTPQSHQLFMGSILNAGPVLVEPIYDIALEGPQENFQSVTHTMNRLQARQMSVDMQDQNVVCVYELSMYKALRITEEVRKASGGKFRVEMSFNSFAPIKGELDDPESEIYKRVAEKRVENNLPEVAKGVMQYLDRL